jgi:hypothetical protein
MICADQLGAGSWRSNIEPICVSPPDIDAEWTRMNIDPLPITPETPLRIAQAAEIAFPDGSMKASGLRRERDAGRLETWFIAGKEFTCLAVIEAMIELCKQASKSRVRQSTAPPLPDDVRASVALASLLAKCEPRPSDRRRRP